MPYLNSVWASTGHFVSTFKFGHTELWHTGVFSFCFCFLHSPGVYSWCLQSNKVALLLFKVIFEMLASKNTQQLKLSLCPQSNFLTKSMLNFFASFSFFLCLSSFLTVDLHEQHWKGGLNTSASSSRVFPVQHFPGRPGESLLYKKLKYSMSPSFLEDNCEGESVLHVSYIVLY